jgi:hypothetical protein
MSLVTAHEIQRFASFMACSGHAATHNPQDLHASTFGVYAILNP